MPAIHSTKPLSFRAIDTMKPGAKDLIDAGEYRGLRVSCGISGTKSFIYRYKSPITYKMTQIKLGNFPAMPLSEARQSFEQFKAIRSIGRCPATEKREAVIASNEAEAKSQQNKSFTVTSLIDAYLEQYIEDRNINGKLIPGARKLKGQKEVRRTLCTDPVKFLGDKPAVDVTRKEVVALVMGIVDRGANVQAGNAFRELSAAYDYAIGLDIYFNDDFVNPCLQAKAKLRQSKIKLTSKRGRRALNDTELAQLLRWLPGSVYTSTQKNAIRLAIWTGCRTGEVVNAEWDDIDLVKGSWHLRETKTEVERYVQLSTQAVVFLKQLKLSTGRYLFAVAKTGLPIQQKQISQQAWRLRETGRMLDIPHWTPHDLRRTVRTQLSRLGCPNEVGEAILGHSRQGIEGTYDLNLYEPECRTWLQRWADHLDELVTDNVVAINA